MHIRHLSQLIFFWISIQGVCIGQMHSPCGPNPVPLSNDCSGACVVCDLNGVSARTTNTIMGQSPPGFCTMVVHSMQWLAFVAGSPNLSINVAVSACLQANGIEMGIYSSPDCSSFTLVSNCNTNMYANQTWAFSTNSPLKPGCIYYLVWDGNGPNECNVDITVTAGSATAPVPNTNSKIMGLTRFCVGKSATYKIAEIFGACEYQWRVVNGSIIRENDNEVEVLWDTPGKGQICVKGLNVCHTGNEVCLDVLIGDDSPPTDLGPFYVCKGRLYTLGSETFGPGITVLNLKNSFNCDSMVSVTVEELDVEDGSLDTAICWPGVLKIDNQTFDSTGKYIVLKKSKIPPFCDSIVRVDLTINKLIAKANKSGDLSCTDTLVFLSADSSSFNGFPVSDYYWLDDKGDTIATNQDAKVNSPGIYRLILKVPIDPKNKCADFVQIEVKGSRLKPELKLNAPVNLCRGDTLYLSDISFVDVQNSNASIQFYSHLPIDSFSQIQDSFILLDQDSAIFIKASNGICTDLLRVPVHVANQTILQLADVEVCAGDTIRFSKLKLQFTGPKPDSVSFYSCDSLNCPINLDYWVVNADTTLFMYPDGVECPQLFSLKLIAIPYPTADFTFDKKLLCVGDSLHINWNLQNGVQRIIRLFQQDSLLPQGVDIFSELVSSEGNKTICMRAIRKGCITDFCDQILVKKPFLPPLAKCITSDTSVLFVWDSISNVHYSTEIIKGNNGIRISDTSFVFNQLGRGEDVSMRLIQHDSICGDQFIILNCKAIDCPNRIAKIIAPDIVCLNTGADTLLITGEINAPPALGKWIFSGPGITDSLQGVFDPRIAGRGVHRILAEYTESGCTYNTQKNILIRENPIAIFNLDSIVCQDSFLLLRFLGRKEDSTTFNWDLSKGSIRNVGKTDLEIKWDTPGKKILKLKLDEEGCLDESSREVEVLPPLEKPEIECFSTDTSVTFRWKKIARAKDYRVQLIKGKNGYRSSDTSYHISLQGLKDTIIFRLFAIDSGPCSESLGDDLTCSPLLCPARKLFYDTTISYCANEKDFIRLRTYLQDSVGTIVLSGPQVSGDQLNFKDLPPGRYVYQAKTINGSCIYLDSISLVKLPLPIISELQLTPIPCPDVDSVGAIDIKNVLSGAPPYEYSMDGINFSSNPVFSSLGPGQHRFYIRDKNLCSTDTLITLIRPESVDLDLGNDLEIELGQSVRVDALIKGSYVRLDWDVNANISCDTCASIILKPDDEARLKATVYNKFGCYDVDDLIIFVRKNHVYVPNVFSPNGDGINDGFTVYGDVEEVAEIKSLEIYDRWGAQIFNKEHFSINDPNVGWTGEYRGQSLMPGVYVYHVVITFKTGVEKNLSGEVSLIK